MRTAVKVIATIAGIILIIAAAIVFGLAVGEADRRDHIRGEVPCVLPCPKAVDVA